MSEYGCKECPENCRASANKKPIYCLYSGVDRARWYEVTSDTPPKLTAEELARRGIEWPEWAKWAAVTSYGSADFFETEPQNSIITFCKEVGSQHCKIPGRWDASDWKNSLIRRPEKKDKLPDWCKVGAWVYDMEAGVTCYGKIVAISGNKVKLEVDPSIILDVEFIALSEARLRPWTKEEMAEKAGKVFDLPEGRCVCIRCDGYCCYFMDRCESEDDTAHIIAYTADTFLQYDCKLDNSPCGVLEHREGDGWVR